MKKILLLGHQKDLEEGLSQRLNMRGFSIKEMPNLKKALRSLKSSSPDFVLCTGKIQIDSDGNYYLEL